MTLPGYQGLSREQRLAKLAKDRPLAGVVPKGYAQGVPESKACSSPPPPDQAWGCLGPYVPYFETTLRETRPIKVRFVTTVTAPSAFEARKLAAVILECEPQHITMEAVR